MIFTSIYSTVSTRRNLFRNEKLKLSNMIKLDLKKEELVKSTLNSINPATIIKYLNKSIINIKDALN